MRRWRSAGFPLSLVDPVGERLADAGGVLWRGGGIGHQQQVGVQAVCAAGQQMGAFRLLQPLRWFRLRAGAAAGQVDQRHVGGQARLRRCGRTVVTSAVSQVRSLSAISRSPPCSAITTIVAFSAAALAVSSGKARCEA